MSHDLLFNPSQITKFISPSPDNVNFTTIPKPQNAFILYRKNYAAKHKSLGGHKDWRILSKEASVAWKSESDKVKNYYKMLTKLAREKHKLIYDKKSNTLGNQPPKELTNFALNLRSYVSNVNDDKGVYEDIYEDISCVAKIRGWTR
nr:32_t:CDS:2 [Entrophospora candida]